MVLMPAQSQVLCSVKMWATEHYLYNFRYMNEWYRKGSWNKEEEADFYTRLSRSRKYNRPQYLVIQALQLVDNPMYDEAVGQLLHKYISEYPDDIGSRSQAFDMLGKIAERKGDVAEALAYFRKAVEHERTYPQVHTMAYLDYGELVVKRGLITEYPYVGELILENEASFYLPCFQYRSYAMLSMLSAHQEDKEAAKHYALLAERSASAQTSGLRSHKAPGVEAEIGLVEERDPFFEEHLKKWL